MLLLRLCVAALMCALGASLWSAQGLPNPKRDFSEDLERIYTAEFKQLPSQERIEFYRSMLADAKSLEPAERERIGNQVAYVLVQLAQALFDEDAVTVALAELRRGRAEWHEFDMGWSASISFQEARALQRLGVLDRAERSFAEAVSMFDVAVLKRETVNVRGYLKAHTASIEFKLYVHRHAEALAELDRFESSVDWEWVESRIGVEARQSSQALLSWLRAHALSGIGTQESQSQAIAAFEQLDDLPGLSVAKLFDANAAMMSLRLQADPAADVGDLLVRMETNLSRYAEEDLKQDIWVQLVLATARVRAATPEDVGVARMELQATLSRFVDYARQNSRSGGVAASRYSQFQAAAELLIHSSAKADVLPLLLEWQASGRLWTALGKPQPSAQEVMKTLCSADAGVLVYVRGDLKDHWIAFDKEGGTTVHEVQRLDEWRASLLEFQRKLEAAPDRIPLGLREGRLKSLAKHGAQLAEVLFPAPLRARLAKWSLVYLVGREELAGLCLEALPFERGIPFGCSHALVDLPSLAIAPELARRAKESRDARGIRLVADSLVPESVAREYDILADLELSEDSLLRALGLRERSDVQSLLHKEASARALQVRGEHGVLHLVVHGVQDPLRELSVHLALTPDDQAPEGLLGLESIRASSGAPLVLLSVCWSADSAPRSGDAGANHLGGAFIESGAHSVVLSPGEVHLDATLEFYRAFYRARAEGASSAEATRLARVALRGNSRFNDIFHWGQTRVFGIGR